MKKIICMTALFFSAGSVFAQLYLRGNIGYNLPANQQVVGTNYEEEYDENTEDYEESAEAVYGSFGSGLSFNLGFGASLNGVIGYDVEFSYLLGKKYSYGYRYEDFGVETYNTEVKSNSFQITPSITFTAGTGNIQPYSRFGPVIGITKLKFENNYHDTYEDYRGKTEYEYTGGISIGFKGVIGVNFNTDKKVQFFGELNFISMSYAPKKGKITAYTINGEDELSSIPSDERKIEFKDEIDPDDEGNVELREKYSMGSIGIQVGVRYILK